MRSYQLSASLKQESVCLLKRMDEPSLPNPERLPFGRQGSQAAVLVPATSKQAAKVLLPPFLSTLPPSMALSPVISQQLTTARSDKLDG